MSVHRFTVALHRANERLFSKKPENHQDDACLRATAIRAGLNGWRLTLRDIVALPSLMKGNSVTSLNLLNQRGPTANRGRRAP
jgi:hypothetical protein